MEFEVAGGAVAVFEVAVWAEALSVDLAGVRYGAGHGGVEVWAVVLECAGVRGYGDGCGERVRSARDGNVLCCMFLV